MSASNRFLPVMILILALAVAVPRPARAGSLDPPADAVDSSSGAPVPTMCTLEEIYSRVEEAIRQRAETAAAPVSRTGQSASYQAGDDGNLKAGVPLARPRFTDNGDGTVTDNQTKLVWDRNVGRFGCIYWSEAVESCRGLADNGRDLTDGSQAGDWRLANINELQSLLDYSQSNPCLPAGHPFLLPDLVPRIWSSTSPAENPNDVWVVSIYWCETENWWPDTGGCPWCVRDRR
jgi:hypothetical protein